ncbi:Stf0 family sulfotransferase [Burkholderia gladioli]|uniref:Stf0 family sulfotransferase n=1 Tax=Burkholderia gladioli TaxID=28095 RepID=UPI00163EC1AE|nr:Stf0 family sulfotransferase [Burkholderia gladioli]
MTGASLATTADESSHNSQFPLQTKRTMSQRIDKTTLLSRLEQAGIKGTFTIAFTPRCGSTVLSNALTDAGLGRPAEYFQYPYTEQSPFGVTPGQHFEENFEALVLDRSANGIFGSKTMHDHRAHLDDWLASTVDGYVTLDDILPNHRWVYIRRENSIKQAVSLYIADETGVWHMRRGSDSGTSPTEVRYDFFAILTKLMMLLSHETNWEAYFDKTGIQPLRITYESLTASPSAFFTAMVGHLNVPEHEIANARLSGSEGLDKISDRMGDVYRHIRERFTEDFLDIGRRDNRTRLGAGLERWVDFFGNQRWRTEDLQ